jgi:hypothetical protein
VVVVVVVVLGGADSTYAIAELRVLCVKFVATDAVLGGSGLFVVGGACQTFPFDVVVETLVEVETEL